VSEQKYNSRPNIGKLPVVANIGVHTFEFLSAVALKVWLDSVIYESIFVILAAKSRELTG